MSQETAVETAAKAMVEFRRELGAMAPEVVDLLAVERRTQELANAWSRATLAEAMKRADTEAPEVVINGERWGNRRVLKSTYATSFGDIEMGRSTGAAPTSAPVAGALRSRWICGWASWRARTPRAWPAS